MAAVFTSRHQYTTVSYQPVNPRLSDENLTGVSCPMYEEREVEIIFFAKWWLEGVIQIILSIIGILYNVFSVIILSRKEMRNTFNQLLTALAVIDIIYMLCGVCISLGDVFMLAGMVRLTPYLLYPLRSMSLSASVFMMISLGAERYVAVYYPFSRLPASVNIDTRVQRRRLILYILPVVFLSVLVNLTKFMESNTVYDEEEGLYKIHITHFRLNQLYLDIYTWSRVVIMGLLPLAVICILNYRIHRAVRLARSRRRELTSEIMNDEHLTVMLLVIVLVFLLCNIPRVILTIHDVIILEVIRSCIKLGRQRLGHGYPMWNIVFGYISHVLLVLNPTLNCVVYCLIGKRFRISAKLFLTSLLPCFGCSFPRRSSEPGAGLDTVLTANSWSFKSLKGSLIRSSNSRKSTLVVANEERRALNSGRGTQERDQA